MVVPFRCRKQWGQTWRTVFMFSLSALVDWACCSLICIRLISCTEPKEIEPQQRGNNDLQIRKQKMLFQVHAVQILSPVCSSLAHCCWLSSRRWVSALTTLALSSCSSSLWRSSCFTCSRNLWSTSIWNQQHKKTGVDYVCRPLGLNLLWQQQ